MRRMAIDASMARSDHGDSAFYSTQWSMVLAAGRDSPDSEAALAALCEAYWQPLYAYVRRRVADVHRAQDLTQEFFAELLARRIVAVAQPERGRFRSFLLTALQNFLANEGTKARTIKHGGGQRTLSLDFAACDSRRSLEPLDQWTPERLFQRQWVITLLDQVLDRLRRECDAAGKGEQFERLKGLLGGRTPDDSIAEAAAALGLSAEAGRQAVHRLRQRYRELLREEVARTVADPREVDDELGKLFAALG
jgi:RNA polymerase sigma-70 factor (ECF subfamily)